MKLVHLEGTFSFSCLFSISANVIWMESLLILTANYSDKGDKATRTRQSSVFGGGGGVTLCACAHTRTQRHKLLLQIPPIHSFLTNTAYFS